MLSHARAEALAQRIREVLRERRHPMDLHELSIRVGQALDTVGCAPLWPVLSADACVVSHPNAKLQYRPRLHAYEAVPRMLAHVAQCAAAGAPLAWADAADVYGENADAVLRPHVLILGDRVYPGSRWRDVSREVGEGGGWSRLGLGRVAPSPPDPTAPAAAPPPASIFATPRRPG